MKKTSLSLLLTLALLGVNGNYLMHKRFSLIPKEKRRIPEDAIENRKIE